MNRFWKWVRNKAPDADAPEERTLFLNGAISESSWFDDDITPGIFKDELTSGEGDIIVWINSPGGDCFAAAQIYNMLRDYAGKVTVKIDSLAASAASVIAMAGDDVLISPTGMLMIHNPSTVAMGDHTDLSKAIEMLNEVKESIINAYQTKTGLSRNKLSQLMEDETWMDARKAVELGFADGIIERSRAEPEEGPVEEEAQETAEPAEKGQEPDAEKKTEGKKKAGMLFSAHPFEAAVTNQIIAYVKDHAEADNQERIDSSEHDSIEPEEQDKETAKEEASAPVEQPVKAREAAAEDSAMSDAELKGSDAEKPQQAGKPVTDDDVSVTKELDEPAPEKPDAENAAQAEHRIPVAECYQRLRSIKDSF